MRISRWISDVCPSDRCRCRCCPARRCGTTRRSPDGRRCPIFRGGRLRVRVRRRGWRVPTVRCTPPRDCRWLDPPSRPFRSEEHTSELQSLMRISYAVFCLKKKKNTKQQHHKNTHLTDLNT